MKLFQLVFAVLILSWGGAVEAAPSKFVRQSTPVPDEYIVVLPIDTPVSAMPGLVGAISTSYNVEVVRVWDGVIRAFLIRSSEIAAQAIASDPRVSYVESNAFVRMDKVSGTVDTRDTRQNPSEYLWHLDRLDDLTHVANEKYNMCTDGSDVIVYLIDTGVMANHPEISSSVVESLDFTVPPDAYGAIAHDATNGCSNMLYANRHWHGTATASVVSGAVIGAARTKVISLKVRDCDTGETKTSTLLDAVNWIRGSSDWYRYFPAVVNHSGFSPKWKASLSVYGDAVSNLVSNRNVPFFTSADNWSTDSCQFSPNHLSYTNYNTGGKVFVTGGTALTATGEDVRWQLFEADGVTPEIGRDSGSNSGACVSAFAPAADIWLALFDLSTLDPAYARSSGTSFSSVIAASLAARYIQKYRAQYGVTPGYTTVYNFLLSNAVTNVGGGTTVGYWACISSDGNLAYYDRTQPTCNTGYNLWEFPATSNTSNARMLYWDEGVCP
jgi:hypothetical protein